MPLTNSSILLGLNAAKTSKTKAKAGSPSGRPSMPLTNSCMLCWVTAWPRVKALSFSYGSGMLYLQEGGEVH